VKLAKARIPIIGIRERPAEIEIHALHRVDEELSVPRSAQIAICLPEAHAFVGFAIGRSAIITVSRGERDALLDDTGRARCDAPST
jgi:hypothetical protein